MAAKKMEDLNLGFWSRTAIFVVTTILNFIVIGLGAQWFGSCNPAWMAALITGTMVIHECAHAIVMSYTGLKPLMFFAVIMGGAMPTKISKYDSLSWSREAAIVIAGPLANLLAVGAAWILYAVNIISEHHANQVMSVNALVFFMNMIPFWKLDGGRFTKLLFDSIPESRDLPFARSIGLAIIACGMVLSFVLHNGPYMAPLFVYFGLFHQATHDDPNGSRDKRAMTRKEQAWWAIAYAALMIIGLTLYVQAKPWQE